MPSAKPAMPSTHVSIAGTANIEGGNHHKPKVETTNTSASEITQSFCTSTRSLSSPLKPRQTSTTMLSEDCLSWHTRACAPTFSSPA
eukprot:6224082-Amphidinium_carterae.1